MRVTASAIAAFSLCLTLFSVPFSFSAEIELVDEWNRQYAQLESDLLRREELAALADQAYHPASLIDPADRDPADIVLRRTGVLLNRIEELAGSGAMKTHRVRLKALKAEAAGIAPGRSEARVALYERACRLRREIALSNPLLDFSGILFVKRGRSVAPDEHMCDQFYGCFAQAGGGLFVLNDPFGPEPSLLNVLAESVVQKGRLKGKRLEPGSFLSPDLSFDGQTILFAYTQNQLTDKPENIPYPENDDRWTPERSYHIFKVNADGSGLVQLTDGPWNDFDPCWLPGGRVAFISERRGGFLRCGFRPCPTYTLHSMNADGSDIVPLSYHETHEWHPSVTHDGMIVYTRWDYVDRDTNVAHHPWLTTPGGRDARAMRGNYPVKRQARPWMEMDVRAVPGSRTFVATAAPHHGQAYGSLVLLDPRGPDDGAMAQLKRLTPEVRFPEAEGGKGSIREQEVYATAWPLSEDFHLCVYDPGAENYGIYLVDAYGNKTLIYRDPEIACLGPMPLQPRETPPVIPHQTAAGVPEGQTGTQPGGETMLVMNVYDSQVEWPANARIEALRIIQVLPKTTPQNNVPRIGVAEQTNARAVLGAVPVEPDGSAYFEIPPGVPVYFQALDGDGLAVQSMRSLTYVQPGERLTCLGCHENRHQAPPRASANALAMNRPPSKIAPEAEGSNPFNYPRLVQPVLDRHCADCHDNNENTFPLDGGPADGFTVSYNNLAREYGFYFNVSNGSFENPYPRGGARTVPGQFGARASKLYQILKAGHYDVNLPAGDMRRITLWLDCNSEFYGAYEKPEDQLAGRVVWPSLE